MWWASASASKLALSVVALGRAELQQLSQAIQGLLWRLGPLLEHGISAAQGGQEDWSDCVCEERRREAKR